MVLNVWQTADHTTNTILQHGCPAFNPTAENDLSSKLIYEQVIRHIWHLLTFLYASIRQASLVAIWWINIHFWWSGKVKNTSKVHNWKVDMYIAMKTYAPKTGTVKHCEKHQQDVHSPSSNLLQCISVSRSTTVEIVSLDNHIDLENFRNKQRLVHPSTSWGSPKQQPVMGGPQRWLVESHVGVSKYPQCNTAQAWWVQQWRRQKWESQGLSQVNSPYFTTQSTIWAP